MDLLESRTDAKLQRFDIVFPLLVFGISIMIRLMGASASTVLEPDEITYIEAGRLYISSLLEGELFSPWWFNFEHPALAKYIIGLSVLVLPLPTYLAARVPSVILGSLTCALTYFLGKAMFSRRVGLVGSIILVFNVRSIIGSKEAMLEAPLTFFLVLSLLTLHWSLREDSMKGWLLSAVSFGLALACKFSAVFLMLVCLPYVFMKRERREAAVLSLVWLVVGVLVFCAIQPRYWLDPVGAIWESVGLYWRRAQRGRWYDTYFMGATYDVAPPHYLLVLMIAGFSPFETIAALSGILLYFSSLRSNSRAKDTALLGLMVVSPFVYLSLIPLKLSHYLVMCMPGVALLAAYGATVAFKSSVRFKEFAATFLMSILILYSAGSVIESYPSFFYYNPIIGRDNYTYLVGHPGGGVTEAVAWIRENVPEDARIGVIGYEQEFQQLDEEHKYVRFNYRASLHHVRDVNEIRYLVVQISMAERIQNPLWIAVREMDPVFSTTLRGLPTIMIFDFGPRV